MPSYDLDVAALALAVVLAAALALLIARILPPLADLIMPPPVIGSLVLPRLLQHPRPVAQRDLGTWPALHRRTVGRQRDQIVADAGDLLDQVLAGRIVPASIGPAWLFLVMSTRLLLSLWAISGLKLLCSALYSA